MVSQAIKTIKAGLITQIETEVTDFNLVTDKLRMMDHYPSGEYPVCVVRIGNFTHNRNLTRTEGIDAQIIIAILGLESTTSDEIEDLYEATVDAINTDLTLGGTCIKALTFQAEPAQVFPRDQRFALIGMIMVSYWREIEKSAIDSFLLLEDLDSMLQETGDRIILDR